MKPGTNICNFLPTKQGQHPPVAERLQGWAPCCREQGTGSDGAREHHVVQAGLKAEGLQRGEGDGGEGRQPGDEGRGQGPVLWRGGEGAVVAGRGEMSGGGGINRLPATPPPSLAHIPEEWFARPQ